MTNAEREAYHTGLYDLPGNVPGRLWPTVGEQQWWERGNRERLAAERRAEASATGSSGGSSESLGDQIKSGVSSLLGGAAGIFAFFVTFGVLDQGGSGALVMLGGAVVAAVVAFVVVLMLVTRVFSVIGSLF